MRCSRRAQVGVRGGGRVGIHGLRDAVDRPDGGGEPHRRDQPRGVGVGEVGGGQQVVLGGVPVDAAHSKSFAWVVPARMPRSAAWCAGSPQRSRSETWGPRAGTLRARPVARHEHDIVGIPSHRSRYDGTVDGVRDRLRTLQQPRRGVGDVARVAPVEQHHPQPVVTLRASGCRHGAVGPPGRDVGAPGSADVAAAQHHFIQPSPPPSAEGGVAATSCTPHSTPPDSGRAGRAPHRLGEALEVPREFQRLPDAARRSRTCRRRGSRQVRSR